MTGRPAPSSAVFTVCLALLGTAVYLAFRSVALAGDGSYYLVRVLGTDDVFGPWSRFVANVVRQAPVLAATAAGVTDTHALAFLLGAGQLVVPALVWSLAVVLSRSDGLAFAAVAMSAGLCAATTWFFSVSESVLAIAVGTLLAVALWRPAWTWTHALLATAAGAVLVAAYEAVALTGMLFVVWALVRARRTRSQPDVYGSRAVASLSALAVALAAFGAADGSSPSDARSVLYFVVWLDPWQLYVGLAAAVAVVAGINVRQPALLRWLLVGLGAAAASIAVLDLEATPPLAFRARGGALLVGLLVQLLLFGLWLNATRRRASSETGTFRAGGEGNWPRWWPLFPVAFVTAMCLTSLAATSRWTRSLDAFRAEVDAARGVVSVDDVLPSNRRAVLWDWTSSSLSLVVRGSADAGVLVDEDPSYVPFSPEQARAQLPDRFAWDDD